jgi:thiamine biosynthesis lipoprotein
MACRFEITLPLAETAAVQCARDALDKIDALEARLTVYRSDSEIALINDKAAWQPVCLAQDLLQLILLCRRIHMETDGAFDITTGPLIRSWGFLTRQGRLPSREELESARGRVGMGRVLLDPDNSTIQFQDPGMELNLGSIGKGYALDRVAPELRRDTRGALLSAGSSSVLAVGNPGGSQGWRVGVRHPYLKQRRIAHLWLRDCAMSTSGSGEQFFEHEGKRYGHILDPRSGQPAQGVAGVTVVARSAALAEALSTAFYVGGVQLAGQYCARHPDVVALMLMEQDWNTPLLFGASNKCDVEILDGQK